jgi:hypothetical protein
VTIALGVTEEVIDLRCPVPDKRPDGHYTAGQLLARLRLAGEKPSFVHPDNLIEMPCDDCRYHLRKQGRRVRRVLHRYDLIGTCIATLIQEDEA